MRHILIVGGLSVPQFDRLKKESEKLIIPTGKLICKPNKGFGRYSSIHAQDLILDAKDYIKHLQDNEEVSILLLYVNFEDDSTIKFLEPFFPFSLPLPIAPVDDQPMPNKQALRTRLNGLAETIVRASETLRRKSKRISGFTSVANLSPLLLPVGNFRAKEFVEILKGVFDNAWRCDDIPKLIKDSYRRFYSKYPLTFADENRRAMHCFSDGYLYFKSPGKNRHGFLKNHMADAHAPTCILNARSRLGGVYSHTLHYDCQACTGSLHSTYDNCHGEKMPPKEKHVNIAPNDYII